MSKVVFAGAAILFTTVGANAANLVQDGNFDASGSFAPYWTPTPVGTATVTIDTTNPLSAPNDAMFTGGSSSSMATLTQSIGNLTIGQGYTVDFWLASSDTGGANNQFNVLVSGGFGAFGQTNIATTPYTKEEFTFLAQSSTVTFEFQGYDASGDLYVDNTTVVTPEPTAMALLGLGSIGMLGRRRRRAA